MLLLLFSTAIVVVAALTATNLQPCLFVAVSVPGVCVLSELVIKVIIESHRSQCLLLSISPFNLCMCERTNGKSYDDYFCCTFSLSIALKFYFVELALADYTKKRKPRQSHVYPVTLM